MLIGSRRMYPHRIRLHGPWECEPLVTPDQPVPPQPRRIRVPARLHDDAGLRDFAGRVRLTRRFGYPGRIDEYEHIWVTLAEVVGHVDVALNGTTLGSGSAGLEFEATSLLASRNRLEVILDADSGDAGLVGEVALEIRRDAFLRAVAARREPGGAIRVTGLVVGTSAMPLELYALADGLHVYYSPIAACAAGQPFDFAFTPESSPQQVQIELVCVAERWYAVEAPVTEPDRTG